MPTYKNLPANRLELLDGNLIVDNPIEGNVVLVIGTAYSGPTGKQVLMNDSNLARKIYGDGSPLLQKAAEAKLGGAKNVLLYRIGGKAASLDGLFGTDSYIKTVDQTSTAGADYAVYVGPQPSNPLLACIIVFQGTKIVYSNVTGAEVDLGKIQVEGFVNTFNARIGTPTVPVALQNALASLVVDAVHNPTGDGTNLRFDIPGNSNPYTVIGSVKVATALKTVVTHYNLSIGTGAGGADEIVFTSGNAPGNGAAIEIKFTRNPFVRNYTQANTTVGATTMTLTNGIAANATIYSVKLVNGVTTTTFNAGNGTNPNTYAFNATTGVVTFPALASGDTLTVIYTVNTTYLSGASFSAGENNIGATLQKTYELLDGAYTDLENTIATEAVLDKATLDAANLADGSSAVDKLTYFRKYEGVDGEVVYEWSTSKLVYAYSGAVTDATHDATANTTTIVGDADLDTSGQPIVSKTFHEVNFAHQFGEFLNSLTENDKFVLGFIGTSAPTSYANAKIASWIGTLPETDIDGTIIGNGTGLLGNKFMAGSTTRSPGFFKTDSGFPDGVPQTDSNGALIDLGKFLSVVSGLVTLPISPSVGTTGQAINGVGVYTGLATTITPGNSTTNELVQRVGIPFAIKKPKLDELSLVGYVVFQQKDRGVVCVSGELATNPNSDYDYISTSIIVRNITNSLRSRLDGFIGKGIDEVRLAAMQTAIDTVFQEAVRAGMIKKYIARVIPTSVFGVTIPYTIVPVFELRDINNIVKLSYDI